MKYSVKTILLFAFSIVLLAGCTNPFVKQSTEVEVDAEVSVEAVVLDEDEIATKIIICDMLKDKENQEDCYLMQNEIATDALYDEIRKTYDLARCTELPKNMLDGCQSYINESGIHGPITMEKYNALNDAMRPVVTGEEEVETYDIANCTQFTTPGLKEYCEKGINRRIDLNLLDEIFESGDINRCDELTDEEFKAGCKEELGGAVETE